MRSSGNAPDFAICGFVSSAVSVMRAPHFGQSTASVAEATSNPSPHALQ
jgi:hypothetical protein